MDNISTVRVLADFVLVKQIMKKKKSVIMMDAALDNKEKFDYSFEVMQSGNECKRDIKVGDHPIFSEYVRFSGLKVLEKDENGMTTLVIVHENDIIGIDNDPELLTNIVSESQKIENGKDTCKD